MEAQAALEWPDGAVELHTVATVDLNIALVINPRHPAVCVRGVGACVCVWGGGGQHGGRQCRQHSKGKLAYKIQGCNGQSKKTGLGEGGFDMPDGAVELNTVATVDLNAASVTNPQHPVGMCWGGGGGREEAGSKVSRDVLKYVPGRRQQTVIIIAA